MKRSISSRIQAEFGLLPAPLEIGDDALEGLGRLVGAQAVVIDEGDLLARRCRTGSRACASSGRSLKRVAELEAVGLAERLQRLRVIGRGGFRPRARRRRRAATGSRRARSSSGSIARWLPSPSQAGQAPNGLLKENSRGSISGMVKPETGQANFSEKRMRSCVSFFDLLADSPPVSAAGSGLSANSATARPSASFSAVSKRIGQPRRRDRRARRCGRPPRRCRA